MSTLKVRGTFRRTRCNWSRSQWWRDSEWNHPLTITPGPLTIVLEETGDILKIREHDNVITSSPVEVMTQLMEQQHVFSL